MLQVTPMFMVVKPPIEPVSFSLTAAFTGAFANDLTGYWREQGLGSVSPTDVLWDGEILNFLATECNTGLGATCGSNNTFVNNRAPSFNRIEIDGVTYTVSTSIGNFVGFNFVAGNTYEITISRV